MDPEINGIAPVDVQAMIQDALKADREAQRVEAENQRARQEEIDTAVKAEKDKWEAEAAKAGRLPFNGNAPYVAKYPENWKYDNLDDSQLSFMIHTLHEGQKSGRSQGGASEASMKTFAQRAMDSNEPKFGQMREALKSHGVTKAHEVQYSTLASYGNDFVPTFNSNQLWANIVEATQIAAMLPSVVVPQGSESITIPVEGANPSFYVVAQATAQTSNLGHPTATVTSSRKGTTSKTLSVAKLGCSTLYTGELEEDSIIPWVPYIRNAIVQEGGYVLDHVIIDGDTETATTTNINDIDSAPAGTEPFMLLNGFRK